MGGVDSTATTELISLAEGGEFFGLVGLILELGLHKCSCRSQNPIHLLRAILKILILGNLETAENFSLELPRYSHCSIRVNYSVC